jgi:HD-GYP domain-containing protein (c-di-GMP phosphodiesterase class II)
MANPGQDILQQEHGLPPNTAHPVRQKLVRQHRLYNPMLTAIKAILHEKSLSTQEHSERMAGLACSLGRYLGLSDNQVQDLELLAIVHDIGKLFIDDRILQKPGKLTAEEWAQIKKHPEVGCSIAQETPAIRHLADSILYHHERWDGSGYPNGLSFGEIPVLARILAVIDAYDAMTNDRAYRKALSMTDAIAEIRVNAGSQFDPLIADAFLQLMAAQAETEQAAPAAAPVY